MHSLFSTKFENGNIIIPKNIKIKNGSNVFIKITEGDFDYEKHINNSIIQEIDECLEEIERIYNKNNLLI